MAKTLKQHHKDRLLAGLAILVALLLLLWWAAAHYHWGPYRIKATTPTTSSVTSRPATSSSTSSTHSSATHSSTSTSRTTTTSTAPAGAGTPIFNLYGSAHNGETNTDVQASAGGMDPTCVTLSSTPGAVQKVCTYQSGDKVVTITYLNDNVVSISKSGF